jgi:hypothetical protein
MKSEKKLYRAILPDRVVITRASATPLRFVIVAQLHPYQLEREVERACETDIVDYRDNERRANAKPGEEVETDHFGRAESELMNSASIRAARAWIAEAGALEDYCERQYALHIEERDRKLAEGALEAWHVVGWFASDSTNMRRRVAAISGPRDRNWGDHRNGQLLEVLKD